MIETLLTSTATIETRATATTDDEGITTYTTTETEVACHVQPATVDETVDGVLRTTAGWVAWFPEGTEIGAGDAFTVDDVTYTVDGPAMPWTPPHGEGHVEVRAQRRVG